MDYEKLVWEQQASLYQNLSSLVAALAAGTKALTVTPAIAGGSILAGFQLSFVNHG